jgi:hypothetical protein
MIEVFCATLKFYIRLDEGTNLFLFQLIHRANGRLEALAVTGMADAPDFLSLGHLHGFNPASEVSAPRAFGIQVHHRVRFGAGAKPGLDEVSLHAHQLF